MSKTTANQLICEAFTQAAEQGRSDWNVMLLSQLKSRILKITDWQFSESDYGAKSFREFAEKCTSVVSVFGDGGRIAAQLRDSAKSLIENEVAGLGWESPEDEIARHRERADQLGVGEILVSSLVDAPDIEIPSIMSRAISAWASPSSFQMDATTIHELIERQEEFLPRNLALATIHIARRMRIANRPIPVQVNDLVFRLTEEIQGAMSLPNRKGSNILAAASATLEAATQRLRDAVDLFCRSTSVTAKLPSIDVLKSAHNYSQVALPGERPLIREIDVVLGPVFRKFCESCEKHQSSKLARRKEELLDHLDKFKQVLKINSTSSIVTEFLIRISEHIDELVAEGLRREEAFTKPSLSLVEPKIKVDLAAGSRGTIFSARLRNSGQGVAQDVSLCVPDADGTSDLVLIDPNESFDLSAGSDQIVTLRLSTGDNYNHLTVPITWVCKTTSAKEYLFDDKLDFTQQQHEPNWDELEQNPPYSINPVRNRAELYGRDSVLEDLTLCGFAGDSTFLWGQKRVGKTSILQVLEREFSAKKHVTCVFLRMGELVSLHEGEIAHTIGTRLNDLAPTHVVLPTLQEFGAGMGKLVPIVASLATENKQQKFIVIIDEFDDIDPSFYIGERGKQFVKALRSLSEVGLTFFFAGSERMNSIFLRHAEDLNKWTNIALDKIESREDCKSLVTKPVAGALEFEEAAVSAIVDYCQGNPFYMHLICGELFRQCWKERRTFVGEAHVDIARQSLLIKLAPTNFAHFWEDNPELDLRKKLKQGAENCLVLTCISSLGGRYETAQEVVDAQRSLGLSDNEIMKTATVRSTLQRLRRRKVLCQSVRDSSVIEVALPVFAQWLTSNSEAHLLDRWRKFCVEQEAEKKEKMPGRKTDSGTEHFPISEDDLLAVSSELIYLGKQKDVAEVRRWLRQFDDDNRIEIAFLLLQRLVSAGLVNDGAIASGLSKMHDAILARRQEIGNQAWKIFRGRNDNLCITFVDSEVKSGGVIARELAKRARPGKCGPLADSGSWTISHVEQDPILVIVDDFTASGDTLVKGINKAIEQDGAGFGELVSQGRVICCVLTAFPEAIEKVQNEHPNIPVISMKVFGDDVRALDGQANIFEDVGSRTFAKDMLLQLGRALAPQMPLGYGDMGVLVAFHNTVPNNTLPIFWCSGKVNGRTWHALLPRA